METNEQYIADLQFTLEDLEVMSAAPNYNRWLFEKIQSDLVPGHILEIGAGVGNLSQLLIRSDLGQYTLLEPNNICLTQLKERFDDKQNVEIIEGMFPNIFLAQPDTYRETFTSIVMFNVLEHIEHDVNALKVIASLLKPGGRLLLIVPAMPALYGEIDERLGHHRRYTKKTFKQALQSTSLVPKKVNYMNMVGAVGWYINFVVLRRNAQSSGQVKIFDGIVTPIQATLERIINPPFGQSLVVVAEKE